MRNLLLTALFIFCALFAHAQGFYVQPGITLLSPATNEVLGPKVENSLTSGSEVNSSLVGSYGSGIGLDLSLGYMLSRNFGIDFGVEYVLGSETLIEEFTDGNNYDRSYASNRRLTLSPAFVVDAGSETLSPFARFGLLIPVAGQTNGLRESNAPEMISTTIPILFPNASDFSAESIAKGQFTIGLTAAFGLRYQFSEKIGIYGSIGYTGLRIPRQSYEVTNATLNMSDGTSLDVLALLALQNDGSPDDVFAYEEYVDSISAEELAALQEAGIANYSGTFPDEIEAAIGVAALFGFDPDNVYTTYGTKENPGLKLRQDASFSTFNVSLGARFSF